MGHGAAACVLVLCGGCHLVFELAAPDAARTDSVDASPDAEPLVCPDGYEEWIIGERSRYRMELIKRAFAGQRDVCAIEGTHLATIETVGEAREIDAERRARTSSPRVFIGAMQAPASADRATGWMFITGEHVPELIWADREPDDAGSEGPPDAGEEDVGTIGPQNAGYVYDTSAGAYYEAVCECDGRPDPLAAPP